MRSMLNTTLCLTLLVTSAEASILTFDGIGSTSNTIIPGDYGDRITSTGDANSYQYGEGNGFTPNIVVDYRPTNTATPFSLWTSGYGDLTNALGHGLFNVTGEVVLTPDAGFNVRLNSFEVAAWSADRTGQIRVLDADDNVLYDSGSVTVPGSSGWSTFPDGPIVSSSALRIEVTFYGDLGLDNVDFDQTLVPIPAALPLLGSALAGLALITRRRRSPA